MNSLLEYSPEKRFTAAECLNHPYITSLNQSVINCINSSDTGESNQILLIKNEEFSFEQRKLNMEDLKNEIHFEGCFDSLILSVN